MPITCIDVSGEVKDVTADAARALGQNIADSRRVNIVHTETVDRRHALTVEGTRVPSEARQQAFFDPKATRWERIRSLPLFLRVRVGLLRVRAE
jgi:hypothetical protein